MAIHAKCTNEKTSKLINLLIYKNLIKTECWHNQCTYHSTWPFMHTRS